MFPSNGRCVRKYSEGKSSHRRPVMRQVQPKAIIADTNIFQQGKVSAKWGGPRRHEVGGGGSILEEIRGSVHAPPTQEVTILWFLLHQKGPLQVIHSVLSVRSLMS